MCPMYILCQYMSNLVAEAQTSDYLLHPETRHSNALLIYATFLRMA